MKSNLREVKATEISGITKLYLEHLFMMVARRQAIDAIREKAFDKLLATAARNAALQLVEAVEPAAENAGGFGELLEAAAQFFREVRERSRRVLRPSPTH